MPSCRSAFQTVNIIIFRSSHSQRKLCLRGNRVMQLTWHNAVMKLLHTNRYCSSASSWLICTCLLRLPLRLFPLSRPFASSFLIPQVVAHLPFQHRRQRLAEHLCGYSVCPHQVIHTPYSGSIPAPVLLRRACRAH